MLAHVHTITKTASGVLGRILNTRVDSLLVPGLQAWQQAPNDFEIRRQLGLKLLQAGRSKEAVRHIKWCLSRRPTDTELLSAGQSSGIELPEEEL